MTLAERLARLSGFTPPGLPALNRLEASTRRVLGRWPDVLPQVAERDREALVQLVRAKLEANNWTGTKLSTVTRAARVAFDPDFRERRELAGLLRFFAEEVRASTRPGFLNPMLSIHIASYQPGAAHTRALAQALAVARPRLGARWRKLLADLPSLLDPVEAPRVIARMMVNMASPWHELKALGIASPHAPGLMQHAHLEYLRLLRPQLRQRAAINRLFDWLKPEGQAALASGAAPAIEALLEPWLSTACPEDLRAHLVERLLSIYGDPRLPSGSQWVGVGGVYRDLMLRWLTHADMRFFIGVVDATQDSHMWQPRRDFWMKLYEHGRIDAAWVAFCPSAAEYARKHLMSERGIDTGRRFGRQIAGGNRGDTSLLILKIGRKIVVEGCHSYKTHIFDESDPEAPRMFQASYDCDRIRIRSKRFKAHNSIPSWAGWVMMNI